MKKNFIITFAGTPGSGKTPIAAYISQVFNLPIFSSDALRAEIAEDNLGFDKEKYNKLRDERLRHLLDKNYSFILDGSIDREWEHYKEMFDNKFDIFVISLNLSQEHLEKIHNSKIYKQTILVEPGKWMGDHTEFLNKYGEIVNLSITDDTYKDRIKLVENKLRQWLSD